MKYLELRQLGFEEPRHPGPINIPEHALTKSAAKLRRDAKRKYREAITAGCSFDEALRRANDIMD
jgi:hypothetical protein